MQKFLTYGNYFVAGLSFINAGCSLAAGDYYSTLNSLVFGILFIFLADLIKKSFKKNLIQLKQFLLL